MTMVEKPPLRQAWLRVFGMDQQALRLESMILDLILVTVMLLEKDFVQRWRATCMQIELIFRVI